MTELSTEEQRYLMDAFAAFPREWFRPGTVDTHQFSDRQIERIVQVLDQRGLMQAEPERHARLTDSGRDAAIQLCQLAKRDWRKFYKRRRIRIAVASTVVGLLLSFAVLRWAGLI